jgi:hypothetical protein
MSEAPDPFASAPADDEAQAPTLTVVDGTPFAEPPAEAAKKAPAKKVAQKNTNTKEDALSEGKLTVTLKGGPGFDAPWIVIHATDAEDALDVFNQDATTLAALMEKVQNAGKFFTGLAPAKAVGGGGAPARPGAEAPAGVAAAPGPDWVFKSGVGKTGKTWKAWMPPRGSDEQPVWL